MLSTPPASAEVSRYRVEILALTHLQHAEQPREMDALADYSEALDFLTPLPETDTESEAADDAPELSGVDEPDLDADPDELTQEDSIPDDAVIHIEEMSEVMQDAWRRLRLSAPFRPQQYVSWEQGSEPPFPSLRLHDLEVVLTVDPYANVRQALQELDLMILQETASQDGELHTGPGPEDSSEIPPPRYFYRLDGSVTLRRTRFLHLDLDIQLREPLYSGPSSGVLAVNSPTGHEVQQALAPSSFLVHELVQSRLVKSGRMEYFDSPVLGILAYITHIESEELTESSGN